MDCAVFSPDADYVLTGAYETAYLWDVTSREKVHQFQHEPNPHGFVHSTRVHCILFSKDGKRIVTAAMDNTVRVWDRKDGTQLAVLSTIILPSTLGSIQIVLGF